MLKIVKGFSNLIGGNVFNEAVVAERVRICSECEHSIQGKVCIRGTGTANGLTDCLVGQICNVCKCYLPAKTVVKNSKCPISKW